MQEINPVDFTFTEDDWKNLERLLGFPCKREKRFYSFYEKCLIRHVEKEAIRGWENIAKAFGNSSTNRESAKKWGKSFFGSIGLSIIQKNGKYVETNKDLVCSFINLYAVGITSSIYLSFNTSISDFFGVAPQTVLKWKRKSKKFRNIITVPGRKKYIANKLFLQDWFIRKIIWKMEYKMKKRNIDSDTKTFQIDQSLIDEGDEYWEAPLNEDLLHKCPICGASIKYYVRKIPNF